MNEWSLIWISLIQWFQEEKCHSLSRITFLEHHEMVGLKATPKRVLLESVKRPVFFSFFAKNQSSSYAYAALHSPYALDSLYWSKLTITKHLDIHLPSYSRCSPALPKIPGLLISLLTVKKEFLGKHDKLKIKYKIIFVLHSSTNAFTSKHMVLQFFFCLC